MYGTETVNVKRRVGYKLKEYPREKLVKDDLPSMVDAAGYVDPNVKIEEAMKAGIRIDEWNRAVFDFNRQDGVDDELEDSYVNSDIYKSELELLEEGAHSLDVYRSEMSKLYRQYLQVKANADKPAEVVEETKKEKPVEASQEG